MKARRDWTEAQLEAELWRDHPCSITHLFPTKSMFWFKSWKSFLMAPKGIRPQHLVGSLASSQEGNTALCLKIFPRITQKMGSNILNIERACLKMFMIYPTNGLKYCDYSEPDPGVALTQVRSVTPRKQKNLNKTPPHVHTHRTRLPHSAASVCDWHWPNYRRIFNLASKLISPKILLGEGLRPGLGWKLSFPRYQNP